MNNFPNMTNKFGLIWVRTVSHSDGILERIFRKKLTLEKKSTDDKSCEKITQHAKS